MKSIRLLTITLVLLVLIISGWFWPGLPIARNGQESAGDVSGYARLLPGELFIREHLTNSDHTLKTNLQPAAPDDANIAQGEESLSESLGLWMLYALEKGDSHLFAQNVDVLEKRFYQDGWIVWKTGGDQRQVSTNALVDDLRIAKALYFAGEKWQEQSYIRLANEIGQSIGQHQVRDGLPVDFFDRQHDVNSDTLTLSYLNTSILHKMHEYGQIEGQLDEKAFTFLQSLPTENGFFPFSYHLPSKHYTYQREVNLIDQLYVALHRAQAGIASPELWTFLKEEFARRQLLYGRYDAVAKQPVVEYESPAVYGLAIQTAIELEDRAFAVDLYERMIRKQIRRPESQLYGGYLDMSRKDTHSFDNLIPLLAERRLFNEGILQ